MKAKAEKKVKYHWKIDRWLICWRTNDHYECTKRKITNQMNGKTCTSVSLYLLPISIRWIWVSEWVSVCVCANLLHFSVINISSSPTIKFVILKHLFCKVQNHVLSLSQRYRRYNIPTFLLQLQLLYSYSDFH